MSTSTVPTTATTTATTSTARALPAAVAEPALHVLLIEMARTIEAATPTATGDREAVFFKLEMLGYNVGMRMIERLAKDHPRFKDTLDVVKFICKEVWMALFGKQVDNLKTNHRGVYVLQDNHFKWIDRASSERSLAETTQAMTPYLWFPCGLLRGVLAGLGISAVVMAESAGVPQCTFQIKVASGGGGAQSRPQ